MDAESEHEPNEIDGASTEPAAADASPRRRLSRRQRRFALVSMSALFTLLVVGAIEAALRIAGYGGYAPTFVETGKLPNGSTLVFTDHGGPTSYFFGPRIRAGSLDRTAFEMPKPAGTFRIMVIGESAAKGNPYPRPLSWASFLAAMLGDVWPDRKIEVVNLGTTAIASFPALGLLTESLAYSPDLVVIYLGNNEFYGAYGVASLHFAGRSPWMIRLMRATRSLAIAQFIDQKLRGDAEDLPKTLMEAMVGRAYIGPDDPARAAAARNLETFVGDMLDRCAAARVPAVVCLPPANERDLAPLGTADLAGLSAADRDALRSALAAATEALPNDPAAAADAARRALAIHPSNANAHFLLGRALFELHECDESAKELAAAIDLDPMPWRPPSMSVAAIRRAAESRGAILCDLPATFRSASDGGSIGWELMADHVHLSLEGQALAARAIVESLANAPSPIGTADAGPLRHWTDYAARLGANRYDDYAAAHAMRTLAAIPFFKESTPEFFERFDALCRKIEAESPPEIVEQLHLWQDPATHKGDNRPITGMVARALVGLGRLAEAEALFRVAADSVTPYGSWELEYRYMMLACRAQLHNGLDDESRRIARDAIARGEFLMTTGRATTGMAERMVGQLHVLLGEYAEAIPALELAASKLTDLGRVGAHEPLVVAYVNSNQVEKAVAIVNEGLRDERYAQHYRRMMSLLPPSARRGP